MSICLIFVLQFALRLPCWTWYHFEWDFETWFAWIWIRRRTYLELDSLELYVSLRRCECRQLQIDWRHECVLNSIHLHSFSLYIENVNSASLIALNTCFDGCVSEPNDFSLMKSASFGVPLIYSVMYFRQALHCLMRDDSFWTRSYSVQYVGIGYPAFRRCIYLLAPVT